MPTSYTDIPRPAPGSIVDITKPTSTYQNVSALGVPLLEEGGEYILSEDSYSIMEEKNPTTYTDIPSI